MILPEIQERQKQICRLFCTTFAPTLPKLMAIAVLRRNDLTIFLPNWGGFDAKMMASGVVNIMPTCCTVRRFHFAWPPSDYHCGPNILQCTKYYQNWMIFFWILTDDLVIISVCMCLYTMYVPYTYECVLAHEISKIRTTRCQAMAKNSLKKFATRTLCF